MSRNWKVLVRRFLRKRRRAGEGGAGKKEASAFAMKGAGLRAWAMRRGSVLDNFHGAVVIAVVAVRVVQAAIDEKVDVVAVRHGFVAAAFAVDMAGTGLHGVAAVGVGGVYIEAVFVVVAVVFVV